MNGTLPFRPVAAGNEHDNDKLRDSKLLIFVTGRISRTDHERCKTSARFPTTGRAANRLLLLRQIVRMRHKQTVKESLAHRVGVADLDASNETT